MRRFIFIISLLAAAHLAVSAQGRLDGRVTDEAGSPMEFVNVVWLSLPDSTYVQGDVTDAEGRFSLTGTAAEGLLRFSFVGYEDLYQPVKGTDPVTVVMKPDEQLLNEVVVKAQPARTRIKDDALVTSVAGTLLEKAGTAEDLLDKIPGVMTEDGSVTVLGRGSALIYINGRRMRNSLELDQLSSDNIKSVEVVTNPGARYPASAKAVVRIYTKKPQGEGWSFGNRTVGAYYTGWTATEQLNFNYRKGNFDIGGTVTGTDLHSERTSRIVQDTYLDKHWEQDMDLNEREHYRNVSAMLNLNYVFGNEQSAGGYYSYNRTPLYDTDGSLQTNVWQDDALSETLNSDVAGGTQTTTHTANLYYSGKAGGWQLDFNGDGYWSHSDGTSKVNEESTVPGNDRVVEDRTLTDNRLYAAKLTAEHALWGGRMAIGAEYAYMHRENNYVNYSGIIDDDINRIKENSLAAFAEYTRTIGKVSLQAGLRYEHVDYDYYDNGTRSEEQSRRYDNLFPSIHLAGPLGKKMQWMLNYGADIARPSYHSLRGNIQYNNPYTYESGNPLLRPTLTHNTQLILIYDWLMFMTFYDHTKDAVVMSSRSYSADRPDIALLAPVNAKAYDALTVQAYASKQIGCWKPDFGVGFRKQWFQADTPQGFRRLGKPVWTIQAGSDFNLPAGFLLTAKFDWQSRGESLNTRTLANGWNMRLIIYKGFMNDRLNLQLYANDIFNTNRSESITYFGTNRSMYQWTKPSSRGVRLTLRYSFNAARSKYRGTGAGNKQKARM